MDESWIYLTAVIESNQELHLLQFFILHCVFLNFTICSGESDENNWTPCSYSSQKYLANYLICFACIETHKTVNQMLRLFNCSILDLRFYRVAVDVMKFNRKAIWGETFINVFVKIEIKKKMEKKNLLPFRIIYFY